MSAARTSAESAVGPWTRWRYGAQVAATVVLAAAAAGLVTWLTERPGLHRRFDLSASRINTLDPQLSELIEKLPERALVHVFFPPVRSPLTEVGGEIQQRTHDLLVLAQNQLPEKLKLIDYDLSDVPAVREVLRKLQVEPDEYGMVVVQRGDLKAVLRLFTDLAQVDVGNPSRGEAPRVASFRGEEALGLALKKVSRGKPPKILFSTGHGERDIYQTGKYDYGALQTALIADGFDVERWDWKDSSEIPAECRVFVVADPRQPLQQGEWSAIEGYLAHGGRLLVAPSEADFDGPGSVREFLAKQGVLLQPGFVANPVPSTTSEPMIGSPACASLFVSAGLDRRHAITESLFRYRLPVWFVRARPIERGAVPAGGVLVEIARATSTSDRSVTWVDLPRSDGTYDWRPEPSRESIGGPFTVAAALTLPAPRAAPPEAGEAAPEARVVVLATPEVFGSECLQTNHDFALNAFNWLASREYRLSIAPRPQDRRILEVRTGDNLVKLRRIIVIGLPALCAVLGAVVAWRRRS
jgi:gliding motility-associatede transport system auxiliary component